MPDGALYFAHLPAAEGPGPETVPRGGTRTAKGLGTGTPALTGFLYFEGMRAGEGRLPTPHPGVYIRSRAHTMWMRAPPRGVLYKRICAALRVWGAHPPQSTDSLVCTWQVSTTKGTGGDVIILGAPARLSASDDTHTPPRLSHAPSASNDTYTPPPLAPAPRRHRGGGLRQLRIFLRGVWVCAAGCVCLCVPSCVSPGSPLTLFPPRRPSRLCYASGVCPDPTPSPPLFVRSGRCPVPLAA